MAASQGFFSALMGGMEVAAGILTANPMLVMMGAGQVLGGIGTMMSHDPLNSFATTHRGPDEPYEVIYGRARVGGVPCYAHAWGQDNQMLDQVTVLACHPCLSVDEFLIENQRVQINSTQVPIPPALLETQTITIPGGGTSSILREIGYPPVTGSGTSESPTIKTTGNISITRDVNGIVTVSCNTNIPWLQAGDQVVINNVQAITTSGFGSVNDNTYNGTFQIAEILAQADPSTLIFTYLCGGVPGTATSGSGNTGTTTPIFGNWGTNIYVEYMMGNQQLGQTFHGMIQGTPWQGTGQTVTPLSEGPANPTGINLLWGAIFGAVGTAAVAIFNAIAKIFTASQPNPWNTDPAGPCNSSLVGKTCAFTRLQYSSNLFPQGIPATSWLIRGKYDIYDPSTGGRGYSENAALCIADYLSNQTWGYKLNYGPGPVWTAGTYYTGMMTQLDNQNYEVAPLSTPAGTLPTDTTYWTPVSYCSDTFPSYWSAEWSYNTGQTVLYNVPDGVGSARGFYQVNQLSTTSTPGTDATWTAIPWGDIPIQPLIDAKNVCAETVTAKFAPAYGSYASGTEARYALNGRFTLDKSRGEILQNMLTACAGRITYVQGGYVIQPGYAPGTLTASQTIDLEQHAVGPITWRPIVSVKDLYNGVRATMISPDNKWQSTDAPYYAQDNVHLYIPPTGSDDINVYIDGERRWLDLQFPFTITSAGVQRLMKMELMRRRGGNANFDTNTLRSGQMGSGTVTLDMSCYSIAPLDLLALTCGYLDNGSGDWTNKLVEVDAVRFVSDGSHEGDGVALKIEIDFHSTDSSIYAWSIDEELTPQGYRQTNPPASLFDETNPMPWSPGYTEYLAGDVLEGNPATFGMMPLYSADAAGNPQAALQFIGYPPINSLDHDIWGPQITLTAGYGGTGTLPIGTYVIAVSARDSGSAPYNNTAYLSPCTITTTNAYGFITISFPVWASGDDGGDVYMAQWVPNQAYTFHHQMVVAPGATTVEIDSFDHTQPGGPDPKVDHLSVTWQQIHHAGVWAEQVFSIASGSPNVITFNDNGGTTANQWANSTLSLLAKWNPSVEVPVLNLPIVSSTASVDLGTGLGSQFTVTVGPNALGNTLLDLTSDIPGTTEPYITTFDLMCMRFNPTFTANSFTDPNMVNSYYTSGITGDLDPGLVAVVLSGPDQGDSVTISAVSGDDTIVLASPWAITPNPGDIVVVVDPAKAPEVKGGVLCIQNNSVASVVATPNVANLTGGQFLFTIRTEDANNVSGPDLFAPCRELYLYGSGLTRTVLGNTTQYFTDGRLNCDTTAGNMVIQLLPEAELEQMLLVISKVSSDANTVTVNVAKYYEAPYSSGTTLTNDKFADGTTTFTLSASGDSRLLKF